MIATLAVLPASIPSPSEGSWDIGGFELRAYALCIMAGIILAIWLGNKRWLARGGEPGVVADVAVWAVPFGIIGGRLYHVITDNQLYFREGRDPWQALRIWEGGLGIWGAIAMGGLGVWIGCRRRGVPMPAMADALAPGILLAQAVGRWGNWFNQELFGRPTDLPWGLEIDPVHRPAGYADVETFHPTFLYESLWAVGVALLLLWADKRFKMGHGRVFALYVAGYTLGRGFWEYLRIDPANEIFGVRVNLWVTGVIFVAAVGYFFWSLKNRPGREDPETLRGFYDQVDPFDESAKDGTKDDAEPAAFSLPDGDDDAAAEKPDSDGADGVKVDADGDKADADGADTPEPKPEADGADAVKADTEGDGDKADADAAKADGAGEKADETASTESAAAADKPEPKPDAESDATAASEPVAEAAGDTAEPAATTKAAAKKTSAAKSAATKATATAKTAPAKKAPAKAAAKKAPSAADAPAKKAPAKKAAKKAPGDETP